MNHAFVGIDLDGDTRMCIDPNVPFHHITICGIGMRCGEVIAIVTLRDGGLLNVNLTLGSIVKHGDRPWWMHDAILDAYLDKVEKELV